MKAQTFVGKVSVEALHVMDEQINQWLERNGVEPRLVTQAFGYERNHHDQQEPVLLTTVWY